MEGTVTWNNTNDSTQFNYSQVDVHGLKKNVVKRVRMAVDDMMTTVKTKVQDAILTLISLIPRVNLAIKSVNASSDLDVDIDVVGPDCREFSVNTDGFQISASNRIHSNTDSYKIDETRGSIIVE